MSNQEHFEIIDEDSDWISKTRMQSFKYCQRQFYYLAILQLVYAGSMAMIRGRKFHYHSSQFYRDVDLNVEPTFEYFRSLLPSDDDKEMNEMYVNFARFENDRIHRVLDENLEPEMFFLPRINEEHIKLPDQKLSGHIDRIFLMKENGDVFGSQLEIKTGKITNKTSLRREGNFYLYIIQESGLDEVVGAPTDRLGAYTPRYNDFWCEKAKTRSRNAMLQLLDNIVWCLLTRKKEDDWPKNPAANCSYCSYISRCWRKEPLGTMKLVR